MHFIPIQTCFLRTERTGPWHKTLLARRKGSLDIKSGVHAGLTTSPHIAPEINWLKNCNPNPAGIRLVKAIHMKIFVLFIYFMCCIFCNSILLQKIQYIKYMNILNIYQISSVTILESWVLLKFISKIIFSK